MENIILAEICKKCAECCKNYPFVNLSKDEIHYLELLTGLDSDVFAIQKRKGIEGYFLQFQDNGNCFFLGEKNGDFSCKVYEARPEICREYPGKPLQKKICNAHKKKFTK